MDIWTWAALKGKTKGTKILATIIVHLVYILYVVVNIFVVSYIVTPLSSAIVGWFEKHLK